MSIADYSFAIWETFYVTVLSTAFSLVIGLPLGVLLVAGDKDGVLPLPGWLMHVLNIIINILRSVPFLILMICVFPLTRAIVGTTVGTKATIVPLVVAAFPFVARLVETSLRELDAGVVEAALRAIPQSVFLRLACCDLYEQHAHLEEAEAMYEELLRACPCALAWIQYQRFVGRQKGVVAARALFKRACAAMPDPEIFIAAGGCERCV